MRRVPFYSTGFLAGTELMVNAMLMGYKVAEYPTVLHSRVGRRFQSQDFSHHSCSFALSMERLVATLKVGAAARAAGAGEGRMKIVSIVGARPEFIQAAPVSRRAAPATS